MSSIIAYPTPKERTIQLKVSTDYAIRIVYYLALKGDTATSGVDNVAITDWGMPI